MQILRLLGHARLPRQVSCRALDSGGLTHAWRYSTESQIKKAPKHLKKRRLDDICCEQHPEYSRNVIQSFIAQGLVRVNGQPVLKAGTAVDAVKSRVEVVADPPKYVCRAGLKLEAALHAFKVDVTGRRALDAGLSTGGFTDCLLAAGAATVIGVDVGYGQVAERVRTDPRVTVMERTNLRHLRRVDLPGAATVDIVTLDLSFISGTAGQGLELRVIKVLDAVVDVLRPGGDLIVLIKPQFEATRAEVASGGVVRDERVHANVIAQVQAACSRVGLEPRGWVPSPIKGATSGNTEFLAHFQFTGTTGARQTDTASAESGSK